jgi:MoxR-like ATPase
MQPHRVGRQLQQARLLFIDEITMMRADELDALVQKLDELSFTGTELQTASCLQLNFDWSTYILLLFIAHRLA